MHQTSFSESTFIMNSQRRIFKSQWCKWTETFEELNNQEGNIIIDKFIYGKFCQRELKPFLIISNLWILDNALNFPWSHCSYPEYTTISTAVRNFNGSVVSYAGRQLYIVLIVTWVQWNTVVDRFGNRRFVKIWKGNDRQRVG